MRVPSLARKRLAVRRRISWEVQLSIAVVAMAGAAAAVFRVTQPDVEPLAIQSGAMPDARSPLFQALVTAYTGARLEPGNRVELLLNGDGTYPQLWRDLRAARRTITIQTYYAQPGAVADTLAAILTAQARLGVDVRLLLDGFGAAPLPERWRERLRAAGVQVATLRPIHWHSMHGAGDRSHVRIVVVDGRVAYTGGFGIADYWNGDGRQSGQWRETNVRLEGPAALQFQAVFGQGWHEATGELLTAPSLFATGSGPHSGASQLAAMLFTTTTTGSTAAERFLALMIAGARDRLYITNSYFVPTVDYMTLLAAAAARGVDVRILTADSHSDVRTTLYAGRHRYGELLRTGIRIYEYQGVMMHAKTMTVDGLWSAVGSMNFDSRSLAFNDESTLLARDSTLAGELDAVFLDDLTRAREIVAEQWDRRPLRSRALEVAANLLSALL